MALHLHNVPEAAAPMTSLMLSERLLQLAQEAARAGLGQAAAQVAALASSVLMGHAGRVSIAA